MYNNTLINNTIQIHVQQYINNTIQYKYMYNNTLITQYNTNTCIHVQQYMLITQCTIIQIHVQQYINNTI